MAFLPTLEEVQVIAQASSQIQALTDTDPLWVLIKEQVDEQVSPTAFKNKTKTAQLYLAAHFLSMAFTDTGGRGPLSQLQIGDVTKAYTLPWLNRKDSYGGTQYGLTYIQIRDSVIPSVAMAIPGRVGSQGR